MIDLTTSTDTVNSVSHLIQLAVASAFLLASVGGLLSIYSSRLSKIIERFDKIDALLIISQESSRNELKVEKLNKQRLFLEKRADNMNRSILFVTTTGILIAFSIITIFMSTFFVFDAAILIAIIFVTGML